MLWRENFDFRKILLKLHLKYLEKTQVPQYGMTEQIQILKRLIECISRDLEVLWIAQKVFSMYLGENRRWVPLN